MYEIELRLRSCLKTMDFRARGRKLSDQSNDIQATAKYRVLHFVQDDDGETNNSESYTLFRMTT